MRGRLSVAFFSIAAAYGAHAEILFEQDFSSSGSISPYVSQNPNGGQWNAIGGNADIYNGSLRFSHSGSSSTAFFARTSDFSPAPPILIYRFDLSVTPSSTTTTAAKWQVGTGFSGSGSSETSGVAAEVGLNFASGGGFSLRYLGQSSSPNGTVMSTPQSITWVINNSDSSYSYLGPNNLTQTVDAGHWDLWEGWLRIFDEKPLSANAGAMTDLKFVFDHGTGSVQMDNFRLETVPEPRLTGVAAAIFLAGLAAFRQWKGQQSSRTQ